MIRWIQIGIGLLVAMGLAGCVLPVRNLAVLLPTPAATSTAAIHPHLQAALVHTPAAANQLAFTNWTVLKENAGVPKLTSHDPIEDRIDFMRNLGQEQQAVASVFGRTYFFMHADAWGWDSTDLLWEATLTLENSPPIYLLRFRHDFDFAPVLARFEEREFTRMEHAGVPLYSHEMDLTAEWLRATEFAILNIAYLEDENIFVLSSAPPAVMGVLDALADGLTLAGLPSVRSVAAAMGEVGAAILLPFGCQPFDIAPLLAEGMTPEQVNEHLAALRQIGSSGVYTVFGLGYRPDNLDSEQAELGVLVLHYLDAEMAKADLEPRRRLAEIGTSALSDSPYSELFQVVDASVQESNLVLTLRAHERSPQLFFNLFYQRDLLFAVCGGF